MNLAHRNTQNKKVIETILSESPTPLTLQEIHEAAQQLLPSIAFSTVYRHISRLDDQKTIVQITWRERGSRYEWKKDPHHHHVVCDSCGDIADIDDETLNYNSQQVAAKTGFTITHHSIELAGVCQPCQNNNQSC